MVTHLRRLVESQQHQVRPNSLIESGNLHQAQYRQLVWSGFAPLIPATKAIVLGQHLGKTADLALGRAVGDAMVEQARRQRVVGPSESGAEQPLAFEV